ncbi:hypothetical protein CPLU01_00495 [Colletotrichum plurivorum]|uniref:Glycoprotease family protein n=1 Tax=Colletotrichum plurivorum TaxID=2175906 RepID=A0A8H6U5F3_9PEZI|nr:hypothetical protein CPLU01_00495 [Colletotrichum plurivorum]
MAYQGASVPQRHIDNRRPDHERDDWEDWEDDDVVTPIVDDEEDLIAGKSAAPSPLRPSKPTSTRYSQSRMSVQKLRRLKSRQRQKAQNAKAGIKVVTDMTALRQQQVAQNGSPYTQHPKFVDAAALRALEGEPNSASVGSWNWLKKKASDKSPSSSTRSPQSATRGPRQQDLSPNDRPIVIGIALPSGMTGTEISPQTAVLETPRDLPPSYNKHPVTTSPNNVTPLTPSQQRSVWSPDTPDTNSPFQSPRATSSIYSQATGLGVGVAHDAPPVPSVPTTYKQQERVVSIVLKEDNADDDDGGSPCTLFEEDGMTSNRRQSNKPKEVSKSPDSAATQTRGWWDTVTTPFLERKSPIAAFKSESQPAKPSQPENWWSEKEPRVRVSQTKDAEPKAIIKTVEIQQVAFQRPGLPASPKPSPRNINIQAPIVKVPTPRRTPSPLMDQRDPSPSSSRSVTPRPQAQSDKIPAAQASPAPSEQPPPYSPPQQQKAVRYRAVFPAGHPLQSLYPPSPGPISPAIHGTMSSQGGISMTDIPLTPAPRETTPDGQRRLPDRVAGTYLPQEHSLAADGDAHRVERRRRRHEKEEVAARKAGGFWKGRGCIPASGCYGRSGREGRKRRRVCLGVCGGILLLSILIVVLCVTLIPRNNGSPQIDSIFVNLTDFPPMPTGVLSVVGPDNIAAVTGCSSPSTVWSCALPKEEHESVAPHRPNQPTFIMQIQWDNSTQNLWKVPNGDPPRPGTNTRRATGMGGLIARAGAFIRRQNLAFTPNPSPPAFQEMYFLGNTTDGVVSEDKAGEPTPFYLSILKSANDTVGPNALDRRQDSGNATGEFGVSLPPPELEADGTGAPAQLFPRAVQQPIRLYDRGLPTEHYGFYTYFKRTIYLKSVTTLNGTDGESDVPLDKDGGSRRSEANFLVTWSQTRFLVQIWTRSENTTQLLSNGVAAGGDEAGAENRPGTMPYPVTVKTDTHGGKSGEKFVWHWPVNDRQGIDTSQPKLLPNDIGFGGTRVNPRKDRDESFGGFDGGTGGCRCEWVNFVAKRDRNNGQ